MKSRRNQSSFDRFAEIAVALEDDRVRNVRHAAPFGGKKGCPARLHWRPGRP